MSLNEIVNVNINVENVAVSRQSFGTMLHLGLTKVFTERSRVYTSVAGLLSDGFAASSTEVAVATAVFSQAIVPPSIRIGRQQTDDIVITPVTIVDNTDYTVTINGTPFTIDSGVAATAITIATALDVAINAGAEPVTSVDGTGFITLNPDVAATPYSVSVTANLSAAPDAAGAETLTVAIAAVQADNDEFYAFTMQSHAVADVLEVAAIIETLKKIYIFSSADADIITSAATDIFTQLAALNYARTAGLYDPDANVAYPEAAWLGVMLPKDPGSATWAYKTLVGQDADSISPTESSNARGKNGNTYETIGGRDITRFGTSAEGEFMDITRGVDWLESRMQERIFSRLAAADKIPYTEAGVAIIEAEIRAQLIDGIAAGVVAADPVFEIVTPVVANIPAVTKATRCLPAITFTATLQGAIHKVIVTGSVTV